MDTCLDESTQRWQSALVRLIDITPQEPKLARNPFDASRVIEDSAKLPQKNPYKLLFDIMRNDRKKSSLARALKRLKTFRRENQIDSGFSNDAAVTLEWIAHRSKLKGFESFGLKALKIMSKLEFEDKQTRMDAIVEEYKLKGIEVDTKKLDKKWETKKSPSKEIKINPATIARRRV